MKRLFVGVAALALTLMVAGEVLAQRDGRGEGGRGGQPGEGGRGGRGGGGFGGRFARPKPGQIMPEFLQTQLKLTADQKKALAALQQEVDKKLSKLLTDEQKKMLKGMRTRGPGGFGPGRGPGGRGGRPGAGGGFMAKFMERLKSYDKNKDGKLSKDELPEALQGRFLQRLDTNNDGVIDQKELQKMSQGFGRGGFGGGRGRGGRPGADGRPGGRGGRPEADRPKGAGRPKGDL